MKSTSGTRLRLDEPHVGERGPGILVFVENEAAGGERVEHVQSAELLSLRQNLAFTNSD